MRLIKRLREGHRALDYQTSDEVLFDKVSNEADYSNQRSERRRCFDAVNHD